MERHDGLPPDDLDRELSTAYKRLNLVSFGPAVSFALIGVLALVLTNTTLGDEFKEVGAFELSDDDDTVAGADD